MKYIVCFNESELLVYADRVKVYYGQENGWGTKNKLVLYYCFDKYYIIRDRYKKSIYSYVNFIDRIFLELDADIII